MHSHTNKKQRAELISKELKREKSFPFSSTSGLQKDYWDSVRKINVLAYKKKNQYLEITVFACKN